ncbi:guanine nucleotide exchange factor VAV3b [Gadus macrocephalus]|uniref:guanine nucleotide exchange factor VAV3b n=1 Tax=Gadus macrocephalus TaxID=80720 RepID=UPI0028CB2638|nr:guanine nucleotide exchange factor VAV3b [Gadus macrocephalus]
MEYWRQCALWLISCKVLPVNHRVTADTAQVFDLAQTLRDGVLLCQLLNNLKPQTINLKEINLRPQMSQFMCLKNIRTFLTSCCEAFGMKKCDLFEAFDLFDVRDFGKVMDSLSKISYTTIAQQGGFKPFPTEVCLNEEDIYNNLEDLLDENTPEDEEEQYAAVYRLEEDYDGGDIYEDLMRTEQQAPMQQPQQPEQDVRSCCLSEIKQTEEKYTETLESIEKYFLNPLKKFFSAAEINKVFLNIPDLVKVHKSLMVDVQDSILNRNSLNLYQIFITYKERLLIYGIYCSQVEIAIAVLDLICKEKEDVRLKLEECAKRANNGKFTLRDLLVVPMQRVLKYHLLLQELVKHTHDTADKSNLRMALDAMKDLAQYVNEVKRDNETLREIDQYQRSIENLNQPLINYGRPKGDGEVRIVSNFDKRKQDRHIFLFDLAVVVCKRRGDNYDLKDVLYLNFYKITNNPTSDREGKKWCYGFYLTHNQGHTGFELFFKTMELKKKWLDQFEMAVSNIRPDNANSNSHQFKMHTFERITSCSFCHLLLRGIFNQGYLCNKCGLGAHKECLGRLVMCGRPADRVAVGGWFSYVSPLWLGRQLKSPGHDSGVEWWWWWGWGWWGRRGRTAPTISGGGGGGGQHRAFFVHSGGVTRQGPGWRLDGPTVEVACQGAAVLFLPLLTLSVSRLVADTAAPRQQRVLTARRQAIPGLPRMLVIRDYCGVPQPEQGSPLCMQAGDVVELISANPHISWWQGKILGTGLTGFFPSNSVRPCPCVPKPVDYSAQPWFAGPMERSQAEVELLNCENSTFLVRHRTKESAEYAISIKFNDEVKHIKILTKEGWFYIAETRLFKSLLDLVEYYKDHSLREGFRSLDTTLQVPYRRLTNGDAARPLPGGSPEALSRVSNVFSPRVVSTAVARYDFSSRDTRELSLAEGDVVKIYFKMSNGWWRGDVDGRVGWFPSTYVEEEE